MPPRNPLPTLSRERLQDKADILENNLFDTISKQTDRIKLHFQILRDQYPDPVIIQALLQLFPRINVHGKKIIFALNQLMARPIPENSLLKTEKQLLDLSDSNNPNLSRLRLTLKIQLSQKVLLLEIKGTPEIPGREETIAQAFFNYEACPGLLLKDGAMDFREINKYPVVKAGDDLFFITPKSLGKPGMSYDGRLIPIPPALPLEINLKEGVRRVDALDGGETPKGYFIRAERTGVVVLTRSGQRITDIEIRDALEIKRLDYTTGNIGTQFICPISIKTDTICNGFRIRARERVEVNVLEGGEIQTDSQAQVHTLEPGSRIMAREDIVVNFARNSVLTSKEGTICIKNELMDSTLFSPGILFASPRGIMTNNTLDAHRICLKNIYFCGENLIYFGRRLFSGEKDMAEARETLGKEMLSLKQEEKEFMEKFHHELKRLGRHIKTDSPLKKSLGNLILASRQMALDIIYKELETISRLVHTKEVFEMKKLLDTLAKIPGKNKNLADQEQKLKEKHREFDREMLTISLVIQGYIRRAASLKIYTGADEQNIPQKPHLIIESGKSKNIFIHLNGTYNRLEGFKIIRS